MGRATVRTVLESLAVTALGLAAGLVANAASDNGIALGRDHLRRAPQTESRSAPRARNVANESAPAGNVESGQSDTDLFAFIDHAEVVEIFHGTGYDIEDIFIDARSDQPFLEGHIPGAYQLDHYRADRYLPELLPVCTSAVRIVVYCTGGSCEDSMLAAEDMMLEGVDPARIFIYKGGINQWRNSGLPIEVGVRLSGELSQEGP